MRAAAAAFLMALAPAALGCGGGSAPAKGTDAQVSITDNAFHRRVDRPVVRLVAGRRVTWRWTSRQSHGVAVRSGPEHFASAIRSGGSYVHTFTRPGTYRIECPLHAPGMRMVVQVRS
jgi:plastocyanin